MRRDPREIALPGRNRIERVRAVAEWLEGYLARISRFGELGQIISQRQRAVAPDQMAGGRAVDQLDMRDAGSEQTKIAANRVAGGGHADGVEHDIEIIGPDLVQHAADAGGVEKNVAFDALERLEQAAD